MSDELPISDKAVAKAIRDYASSMVHCIEGPCEFETPESTLEYEDNKTESGARLRCLIDFIDSRHMRGDIGRFIVWRAREFLREFDAMPTSGFEELDDEELRRIVKWSEFVTTDDRIDVASMGRDELLTRAVAFRGKHVKVTPWKPTGLRKREADAPSDEEPSAKRQKK